MKLKISELLSNRLAFSEQRPAANVSMPLQWDSALGSFPDESFWRTASSRIEAKRKFNKLQKAEIKVLREAWFQHLLTAESLLHERLTFFWSGFFTCEAFKVLASALLYRQYRLLHLHATGNFRDLLMAISTDAGMLRYLDGAISRKQQPNENYARELLELFTLGEGHYTEQDIKTIARALTGWRVLKPDSRVEFRANQHDATPGLLFGRKRSWDLPSVIDALLAQPRLAEHVVERMWREFVSFHPDPVEVRRLAAIFRDANYELEPLWQALFDSPFMLREVKKASLIKSPIELVIGTMRQFRLQAFDVGALVQATSRMGQTWFAPPNVKGWPGGTAWIDGQTLVARQRWLQGAVAAVRPEQLGYATNADLIRAVMPREPVQRLPASTEAHELIELLVQDPAYQLK